MPNDDAEKAAQFGAVFIDLEKVTFTPEILRHIPAALARKHQALPFRYLSHAKTLSIVINDPSDLDSIEELHRGLPYDQLEVSVANAQQLRTFIEKLYPLGA